MFECEFMQLCAVCVAFVVSAFLAYFNLYFSFRTGILDLNYD